MIEILHDNIDNDLLCVRFSFDPIANNLINQIAERRWSKSRDCWLVPNRRDIVIQIGKLFGKSNCTFSQKIILQYKPEASAEEINQYFSRFKKAFYQKVINRDDYLHPAIIALVKSMKVRNYSYKTIKNYRYQLVRIIHFFKNKPLENISTEEFNEYLYFLAEKKKLSGSSINVAMNTFKYFIENILNRESQYYQFPNIIKPKQLPEVLSTDEVTKIIKNTSSIKYQTIFMLIYSAGLRVSEATNLKIRNISKENRTIFIKNGKGKKDRYVPLSDKLLVQLRAYYVKYRPVEYLFENDLEGGPISDRSLQYVFSDVLKHCKINKNASIHTLRHSFATHLLAQGTNIRYIQELLGHSSIITTMRYTHIENNILKDVKSPLDSLDF